MLTPLNKYQLNPAVGETVLLYPSVGISPGTSPEGELAVMLVTTHPLKLQVDPHAAG